MDKEKVMDEVTARPRVSIGMPVYNGEKYIREAIDSLLNQNYSDFELIISDNASTDNTQQICQQYAEKDSRINYIRQAKNIGPVGNFTYVRDKSSGEYFMWAACDDIWSVDWLKKLIHELESSKCGAAFGQVLPIDSSSIKIKHVAIGRSYQFLGKRVFRRMKFFLEPEVLGKANLFYSIFRKSALIQLELSSYQYDYSMIYMLLDSIGFESVGGAYLYKRDHSEAAGNVPESKKSTYFRFFRAVFPLPKILLREYFQYSSIYEKLLILMLLPYKVFLIYMVRLRIFVF